MDHHPHLLRPDSTFFFLRSQNFRSRVVLRKTTSGAEQQLYSSLRERNAIASQLVTADDWGNYTVHSDDISIYSLAQCHRDLSHDDCLQCYAASRTRLPHCLPSPSGRIFLDGCFLRYDNYSFFDERTDPVWDNVNCNSTVGVGVRDDMEFGKNAAELMDNLTAAAVANGGHAADGIKGVFGLAECWKTLSRDGCGECLAKANREVKACMPSREGRAY
ncbi:cysteine-rich receptor-like protein kinase 42 [Henckelia pumila]|uniref:cysteine-rich receptor-like protein kinase 42 n=1 Tax=Henckelia pumila TaxID=405737 RepID=UPI003C6E48C6